MEAYNTESNSLATVDATPVLELVIDNTSPLPTEHELVERWLMRQRSVATQRQYARTLLKFRHWLNAPLLTLSPFRFEQWCGELTGSDNYRGTQIATVKSFYSFATKMQAVTSNPTSAADIPRRTIPVTKRLIEAEDVRAMIDSCTDLRDRCLLELLYGLGLRISEACGLTWADFSQRRNRVLVDVCGKGSKWRTLDVPLELWQHLTELRATLTHNADTDPVVQSYDGKYRNQTGRAMSTANATKLVKGIAVRCGLSSAISAHWLRHCHISHALDNGAAVQVVSESAGHSSLSTTTRYAHARDGVSSSQYIRF